jgi:hypothetical protein
MNAPMEQVTEYGARHSTPGTSGWRLVSLLALLLAACGQEIPVPTGEQGLHKMGQARELRASLEIRQLKTEAEAYWTRTGEWPEEWSDVRRSGNDPWGHPYVLDTSDGTAYVFSAGPDGEIDTEDDILPAD